MNHKLLHIAINGIRTFVLPATLFFISYYVVHTEGQQLWGTFVAEMLLVHLVAHVLQWGQKELLMRAFSHQPSGISSLFYSNLFSRGVLLLPALVVLIVTAGNAQHALWLCLWLLGLFLYQSGETLIVYSRKFGLQIVAELIAFALIISYLITKPSLIPLDILRIFSIAVALKAVILLAFVYPKGIHFSFRTEAFKSGLPFFIIGLSGLLQSRADQYVIALFCEKEVVGSYQIFLSAFILIQSLSSVIVIPFQKIIYRINTGVFLKFQRKMTLLNLLLVTLSGLAVSGALIYFYELELDWRLYIIGTLFSFPPFIYVPIILLYYRVEKEREVIVVNYAGAIFNLIMTLLLVYSGNPFGAIVASCIAQWIMLFWYLYRKKHIINAVEMSRM